MTAAATVERREAEQLTSHAQVTTTTTARTA